MRVTGPNLAGAARHRRQDRHGIAVSDRGPEAADEADVLVVQVYVDEPPQAGGVHEPVTEPVIAAVEISDQLRQRGTRALDRLRAAGIGAENGRDTDLDSHVLSAPRLCVRVDTGSFQRAVGHDHSGSTATSSSVTSPSTMRNDRNCGRARSAVEIST